MRTSRTMHHLLPSLLAAVLLAGCLGKTPAAAFYTLRPIEIGSARPAQPATGELAIGIGPIKFPDELDRPAIVTRSAANRLEVNEYRRWGGSLEKNVARVMVENLALLLGTDRVMARPWERYFQPTVRIALDIRQFDGRLGESATLNVTWTIIGPADDVPLFMRRTIIQEAVAGEGYDALVEAQSQTLNGLCREIAAALAEMQATHRLD